MNAQNLRVALSESRCAVVPDLVPDLNQALTRPFEGRSGSHRYVKSLANSQLCQTSYLFFGKYTRRQVKRAGTAREERGKWESGGNNREKGLARSGTKLEL